MAPQGDFYFLTATSILAYSGATGETKTCLNKYFQHAVDMVHTCIHIYIHTYTYTYTHTHTHIYIYIYTYIHAYKHEYYRSTKKKTNIKVLLQKKKTYILKTY